MKANLKAKAILVLTLPFLVIACAHHRDVRPGEKVHRVVVKTEDDEEGTQNAIMQANHFCDSLREGSHAVFLQEKNQYTGDMDEKDYKNGKRFAKVAKVAGGGLWAFGGKGTSAIGGIAALGGMAGDAALGKGYTVQMSFRCR